MGKKFSVSLPDSLDDQLEKEAEKLGITKTELIRQRLEQSQKEQEKGQGSTLEGTDTVPQKTFPEPEKPYQAPQKPFSVPKKPAMEPEREWEEAEYEPEKPMKRPFTGPKYRPQEDPTVYVEPRGPRRGPLRTLANILTRTWDAVDSIFTIAWNTFALAIVVGVVYYLHHHVSGGYLPGGEKVLAWYSAVVDWIVEVVKKLVSSAPDSTPGAGK